MDGNIRLERGVRNNMRERSPERVRLKQKAKASRKVQVVYYLSRNGLLEHPHFMELSLLPNQPLRLKDVLDRLMALRGSGMPLQYSWSSKRNYKSGYVWHDLSAKDIIHPAEGGEYVLKGSELVEGYSGSVSERFNNVMKKQGINEEQVEGNYSYKVCKEQKEYEEEEEEEEYEEEEKRSRHGGGVWRREEEEKKGRKGYSVLLQLIACGSELKGKPRLSDVGTRNKKEGNNMIWDNENPRLLGNNTSGEEKEYFSGSFVESMKGKSAEAEAVLNKSNSYNEHRRSRLGMEPEQDKVVVKDKCIPLIKSPKQTTSSTS
ncbi:hypothetical protein Fmac_004316 [Flemingia macrophylla]|uniref:SOSEKI DIX-like domain-containing protein n=1 Tax=Flemingia macrophylla TaxID=520843 RepID=A0ABD1N4K2_9FABA